VGQSTQKLGLLLYFSKNCLKQSSFGPKVRPIWSPCCWVALEMVRTTQMHPSSFHCYLVPTLFSHSFLSLPFEALEFLAWLLCLN
jgi:hypothetical protein